MEAINMSLTADQLYRESEKLKAEGDIEGAIGKLNEGLGLDPNHVMSHLALAVLYFKTGDAEKSIAHGVRATEIDPNDPFNFTALSVTYQRAWQRTNNQDYIRLAEDAMAKSHMLQGR
jgi:tetratricopeptide (TPR) repeat protein